MKKEKLKLYYVTQTDGDVITPIILHEAFIIAGGKKDAVWEAKQKWEGPLEQFQVERVRLKSRGFLTEIIKQSEKSPV